MMCSVHVLAFEREATLMLNGDSSSCSLPLEAMPDDTRRGARKGDLGGDDIAEAGSKEHGYLCCCSDFDSLLVTSNESTTPRFNVCTS